MDDQLEKQTSCTIYAYAICTIMTFNIILIPFDKSPLAQFPIVCHSRKVYRKASRIGLTYLMHGQVVACSIVGNNIVSQQVDLYFPESNPETWRVCPRAGVSVPGQYLQGGGCILRPLAPGEEIFRGGIIL